MLGIPVATDKVEGPVPVLTFLGLELDNNQQCIRLPPDKHIKFLAELHTWSNHTHTTKQELLSLIGKLVPAGNLFLWHLISPCVHHCPESPPRPRYGLTLYGGLTCCLHGTIQLTSSTWTARWLLTSSFSPMPPGYWVAEYSSREDSSM